MCEKRTVAAGVGRGGFTLAELLVVIAVIAILMAVLLPALAGARKQGWLIKSMSNARQLTVATTAYTHEHDNVWPVIPAREPEAGAGGTVWWCSWNWGGKSASDYWGTALRDEADEADDPGLESVYGIPVQDRVVNPYVYPELDLQDGPDGTRIELEIFSAPGDEVSYQRRYWAEEPSPEPISSYDDVGTSYHMNLRWWFDDPRTPGDNSLAKWQDWRGIFRRAESLVPSKFVWMYDQTMDVASVRGFEFDEGNAGGDNRSVVAYMDGHVRYVRVEPGAFRTSDYDLIITR